ncbi:hypothetical protein E6C51_13710 [Allorhizobium terrae]|uniref:GtrA family protein n=2 Tax=Allorhizobium terrae TaxID=1848972 RepID=A0A4S3ZU12_9HYPH|nr:hypothetical protein E6C51_13710 [Allorhizobium terrae]
MSKARPAAWIIAAYCALVIAIILVVRLSFAQDYVGADNDDAMRLVEVRDFLAGQGWFDMMQYRLGLLPGTLMHWSRLIDFPIAVLIRLSSLMFPTQKAEAIALAIWPLLWVAPVMASLGCAALKLGGRVALHVALGLTGLYLLTSNRFLPGSIDHHNVQIALMAFLAMVLSVSTAWQAYAAAGVACALALAIGAETTPIVAVACLIVAVKWGVVGKAMQVQAASFSLALALFVSLFFVGTVPPAHYGVVTCDNLSFGYYALTAMGGGLLCLASVVASRLSLSYRLASLALIGAVVGVSALKIAPQCLGNPLANLDPLLVTLWLNNVGEAMSFSAIAQREPSELGAFYAVGFLALLVCCWRIWRKDRAAAHAVLALLLATSWAVSLIQVRGNMFANMLAIVPLALLIADLRETTQQKPWKITAQLVYIASILCSVPVLWAVVGVFVSQGPQALRVGANTALTTTKQCKSAQALAQLASMPATTVAASSEIGTAILRFTHHRVLTAPYHRDQGGMLTELHIGLSTPKDAQSFLHGAGVGIVAFCPSDAQTKQLIELKSDGLYAALAKGAVPDYLAPLPPDTQSGLQLFSVR